MVVFNDQNFNIALIHNLIKDMIWKPTKINSANIIADDWVRLRPLRNYSTAAFKLFVEFRCELGSGLT